jgi:hypothetical protein
MANAPDSEAAVVGLSNISATQQVQKPGRGLSFKDLGPELLAMIFENCDDLNNVLDSCTIWPIPPLIKDLRPQERPYYQALETFFRHSYVRCPQNIGFETPLPKLFPFFRKICIQLE